MNLKTILVLTLIGCTSFKTTITAQKNESMKVINQSPKTAKEVLLDYLKAGDNSDTETINACTHETYRVIYNDISKAEVKQIDKARYISLIEKKIFGGKPRTVEIVATDKMGEAIANFKVKTTSSGGTFFSYFSLTKTNGRWFVVQDLIYQVAN